MLFSFLSFLLLLLSNVVNGKNRTDGRVYAVSNRGPIAAALGRYPTSQQAVSTLVAHFNEIGASVRKSRSCSTSTLKSWMSPDLRTRFPGEINKISGCITEIHLANSGKRVWNAINTLDRALNASGENIMKDVGVNWSGVYVKGIHNPFSDENCKMHSIGAFRTQGKWMIAVSLISLPMQQSTFFKTSVMTEYISESGESFRRSISKADGHIMKGATTTLLNGIGNQYYGCCTEQYYRKMFIKHRKWIAYASESLQASNIATMVLPLFLSLLPMALFVESNTAAGLFYTLLTNILNVIPLAFRGAELIRLSNNPPLSTNTVSFGLETPHKLGAAATWVLRCEIDAHLSDIGAWFIGVSIFAMILGLYLEIRVRRNQKLAKIRFKLHKLNDPLRMLYRSCIYCRCTPIIPLVLGKNRKTP